MPSPNQVKQQIDVIIRFLLETGLADDQRFPIQLNRRDGLVEVTFEGAQHVSLALKDLPYDEIYRHLAETRAYNAKLLDGALLQMMYRYANGILQSHRLAFFPSPYLDEFQNNPDIYLEEVVYADVVGRNIVPVPVRFDYNAETSAKPRLPHPKAHLTLGQYENCRIPVTAPMIPLRFADFVLRNFYHTAFRRYAEGLPTASRSFEYSILGSEQSIVHIVVPT